MVFITLFGRTTAEVNGKVLSAADLGGVKPRQILEMLALEAGSPVAKDRLAELLWAGKPPATYLRTLESHVCVLRRCLGLDSGKRGALATSSSGYRLNVDEVTVDFGEFRRLAGVATLGGRDTSLTSMQRALRLVRGELLADEPYTAWAVQAREQFRRDLVTACLGAAGKAAAAGDHPEAARLARMAVDVEPSREDAVQQLMAALWRGGRRCEALSAYGSMRQWMRDEFGMEPSRDSQELYLAILRDGSAAETREPTTVGSELRTLLGLLRQALDAAPGVRLAASDVALTGLAANALSLSA